MQSSRRDDGHVPVDVDVVRREQHGDIGPRRREGAAEIFERGAGPRCERALFGCAPLGDRDAAVRRDGTEDDAHQLRRAVTIAAMIRTPRAICA